MTPAEMIEASAVEGVMVSLTPRGDISLKGDTEAVSRWVPTLKSQKSDLVSYLTAERAILDWLQRIEEADQETIDAVLFRCRQEPEAMAYFLWRCG